MSDKFRIPIDIGDRLYFKNRYDSMQPGIVVGFTPTMCKIREITYQHKLAGRRWNSYFDIGEINRRNESELIRVNEFLNKEIEAVAIEYIKNNF